MIHDIYPLEVDTAENHWSSDSIDGIHTERSVIARQGDSDVARLGRSGQSDGSYDRS